MENENSFWNSSRIVPGRPRNRNNPLPVKTTTTKPTSFQNFQLSVSDAWDSNMDDLIVNTSYHGKENSDFFFQVTSYTSKFCRA